MSSVEQLTPVDRLSEANPASDSFASCGSNWDLLGDLMIDLGGEAQAPLKMQNAPVCENLAPKPDPDKGLKMKIKRKSKNEEKHEIITPEMERQRQTAVHCKLEDTDCTAPTAKKARPDKAPKQAGINGVTHHGGRRDACVNTATVGTGIEPDCLGPCESGTSISLDGIVWLETNTGVLVVNVTWRGRTYVGTLLDSSQHDLAPPCPKEGSDPVGGGGDSQLPSSGNGAGGDGVIGRWLNQQQQQNQIQLHQQTHLTAASRGRGAKRRGGRPAARQLPLATSVSNGVGGAVAGGLDLPHIQCPEPGCDKRFSKLQALRWHSISQHQELQQQPQCQQPLLREEKSLDGSSVFKVPQPQPAHQPPAFQALSSQAAGPGVSAKAAPVSGAGVVTVTKTCPVPHQAPAASSAGGFKPIVPKAAKPRGHQARGSSPAVGQIGRTASGTAAMAAAAGRRTADPVSPAYSDISDEGGAPTLEKIGDERDRSHQKHLQHHHHHQLQLQHQASSDATSLTNNGPSAAAPRTSPPPPPLQMKAPTVAPIPAASPRTPLPSPTQPKPSLGHSPSETPEVVGAAPAKDAAASAATAGPQHRYLTQQQQQRGVGRLESPRRPPPPPALPPGGHGPPWSVPPSQAAAQLQQQSSPGQQQFQPPPGPPPDFDPYRGFAGPNQFLPGLEALSQYAAAAAAACRPPQQPQHHQFPAPHSQHKIHELGRTGSPKASPPPLAPFHQHHQSQQHHRAPQPPPHHHHHHPGFVDPFGMQQFSMATQMLSHAPPHYLHPK